MTDKPTVVERLFDAPISKVWNAITDKEEMKKWYLAEFEAEVGFTFQFAGGPPDKQYLHLCEITEVITEKN